MKLSVNWLQDFIDISNIDIAELSNKLSLSSCEVDAYYENYAHLKKIEIAKIIEVKKHPHADRLHLCKVKTKNEILDIVCGASNVKENMWVALAPLGAKLPLEDSFLEIRKAKIRGLSSFGMLCSAKELGLDKVIDNLQDKDGILDLSDLSLRYPEWLDPKKLILGDSLLEIFSFHDFILDIDNKSITHRPDLWSHFGFARELSLIFQKKLKYNPLLEARPLSQYPKIKDIEKQIEVHIEKGAALAYFGLLLEEGVCTISPLWLQSRLINVGQRPINNLVDASNYILFAIGQPNHIFDRDRLEGSSIHIGFVKKDIDFVGLDEQTYKVKKNSILIQNKKKEILALGGIIGGKESSVSSQSSRLFLESACFPRSYIRKTISQINLRTDSAQRFEKGLDPALAQKALAYLLEILSHTCPNLKIGKVAGEFLEKPKQNKIHFSLEFLQKRLGFPISKSQVEKILKGLNFQLQSQTKQSKIQFKAIAPSYRSQYDVSIPEDIVEEIGRIYGYDNIQAQAIPVELKIPKQNHKRWLLRKVRDFFATTMEASETYNYSYISSKHNSLWEAQPVRLKNPVFENKEELRLSLVPGLLDQGQKNQDRFLSISLFEVGRIYQKKEKLGLPYENTRLVFLYMPPIEKNKEEGLLEIRQKLQSFFQTYLGNSLSCTLSLDGKVLDPLSCFIALHPKAKLAFYHSSKKEKIMASLGLLHLNWAEKFQIKRNTFVFELDFDQFFEYYEEKRKEKKYKPPSIYPSSYFEISLLLNKEVGSHKPCELIQKLKIPELQNIRYLKEYQGEPIAKDQKSVSYEFECADTTKTLAGERLQEILDTVVEHLKKNGFPLRT